MNRTKFICLVGGSIVTTVATGYLLSDKSNLLRNDIKLIDSKNVILKPDETEILHLASLASSAHNAQPWFVQYLEPYSWIIGNDKSKWLPAVDPTQRETILSIGTFIQNLEYAASAFGYICHWNLLAKTNQDEQVLSVKLNKIESKNPFDTSKIKERRTVRSNFLNDDLKTEDRQYLINSEPEFIHYLPSTSKEGQFINEQTIVANRLQTYRDPAQQELANWIRFSTKDAEKYRDGLTTASMEIEKNIAIHPMNQILEESSTRKVLNQSIGLSENIQFILRVGYLKNYPEPVSLRRPVDWFVHL